MSEVGLNSRQQSQHSAGNLASAPIHGVALQNATGDYHCFLNVLVQCLWHLQHFRMAILHVQVSPFPPLSASACNLNASCLHERSPASASDRLSPMYWAASDFGQHGAPLSVKAAQPRMCVKGELAAHQAL